MNKPGFLFFVLLMIPVFMIGCGGEPAEPVSEESDSEAGIEETAEEMTPEEIGKAISDTYIEAMTEVCTLLEERPEPDAARTQLEEAKEQCIQRMVKLGRMYQDLGLDNKIIVDTKVMELTNDPPADIYNSYSEIRNHYLGTDIFMLVDSFNTIVVYADFDKVKMLYPEEAERLGL